MLGEHVRAELRQPLPGDRNFVRTMVGFYTLRHHPEHIGRIRAEKARLRVELDVTNYRRMLTHSRNMLLFG